MVPSTAAERLLQVWEVGQNRPPLERGLLLLTARRPDIGWNHLADWPIGDRDRELMQARQDWFGDEVEGVVECPRCSMKISVECKLSQFMSAGADAAEPMTFERSGARIGFRRPTTNDLLSLRNLKSEFRRAALVQRCMQLPLAPQEASGENIVVDDELCQIASAQWERTDAQADVRLDLDCIGCGSVWQSPFDIAVFLWNDLAAWAERLLAEIHTLARAYGWSEQTILGVPAFRRQRYLQMVRA